MIESWRPIAGYEGLYEVSDLGRVKSLGRHIVRRDGKPMSYPPRIMVLPLVDGYPRVTLSLNGEKWCVPVHILVCTAFHGPKPSPIHEVAHGDGNPGNAAASNLRWATHAENEADKRTHGTLLNGEAIFGSKLTESDVREIRKSAEGSTKLARRYGISTAVITNIRCGRLWKHLDDCPPYQAPGEPHLKLITFNGMTKSISGWCRDLGMARKTFRDRIARGWSLDRALTTPPDSRRGPRRQFSQVELAKEARL